MNLIPNSIYYSFIIVILHSKAVININIGEKEIGIDINNGVKYINTGNIFLEIFYQ